MNIAMLTKGYTPNKFESHNSLKLSFLNIWGLHWNFFLMWIFSWMKLSWYSCSMWDKLEWLHWLCFSVRGYLPLIQKIVTYMHGLAVYVKEGIPFAQDLFGFLFMFLTSFTWLCVSYIFLLNQLLSPLSTVFNANSSDIDYVLSINPSANVLFFRDFNIHHNNWLTYSSNNWLTGCPISLDSLWLILC